MPVVLYAGAIFWLSSLPEIPSVSPEIPFFDKFAHTLEYFVLGILLHRAFKNYGFAGIRLWVVIVATIYAASDEIHQYFVPPREASLLDLLFDGIGAYMGTLIRQK